MKKWLTIPLAMSLLVSLAACGETTPSASVAESAPAETQAQAPSPEPGAPVEEASTPEAAPIPEDSQVEDSIPEVVREGPTIQSVTYGANYVETAATDDDTINSPSASSNVSAVTLSDGTEITATMATVVTISAMLSMPDSVSSTRMMNGFDLFVAMIDTN